MARYSWDESLQRMTVLAETVRYRSKWACFECRKAFTRTRESAEPDEVVCPDCNSVATDMGYLFETPPKRDDRLWKIMEVLGQYSFGFYTAGNVAYIRHMITGNNKLSPKEVENNVIQIIKRI